MRALFAILTILCALALPLLMLLAPVHPVFEQLGMWVVSVPFVLAVALALHREDAVLPAIFGALALALGLSQIHDGSLALPTLFPKSVPQFHLRDGFPPADLRGYAKITGRLHESAHLDEYQVAPGERPDQNVAAPRVLVPLLAPGETQAVGNGQAMVIARISRSLLPEPSNVTEDSAERQDSQDKSNEATAPLEVIELKGRVRPADPELAAAIIDAQVQQGADDISVLLLDTETWPSAAATWTRLILGIASCILGWFLWRPCWVTRETLAVQALHHVPDPDKNAVTLE